VNFRVGECAGCNGEGRTYERAWIYEHGCGFGHWDTFDAGPCLHCDGTGGEIITVHPIEMSDLDGAAS
jgi:hypothetical protein